MSRGDGAGRALSTVSGRTLRGGSVMASFWALALGEAASSPRSSSAHAAAKLGPCLRIPPECICLFVK